MLIKKVFFGCKLQIKTVKLTLVENASEVLLKNKYLIVLLLKLLLAFLNIELKSCKKC